MIEADYLMKNHMEGKNLFLFLSNARDDSYFCRSFFSRGENGLYKESSFMDSLI